MKNPLRSFGKFECRRASISLAVLGNERGNRCPQVGPYTPEPLILLGVVAECVFAGAAVERGYAARQGDKMLLLLETLVPRLKACVPCAGLKPDGSE